MKGNKDVIEDIRSTPLGTLEVFRPGFEKVPHTKGSSHMGKNPHQMTIFHMVEYPANTRTKDPGVGPLKTLKVTEDGRLWSDPCYARGDIQATPAKLVMETPANQ